MAFGLLLVLAGVVGAAVLFVTAAQRPGRAVERFARGPVGCTVTLEFANLGTYYVYEERLAADDPVFDTCEPVASGDGFAVELFDGDRSVALRDDASVAYDTERAAGTSIGRVEITDAGRYQLVVRGDDPSLVAAVGRDPDTGVSDLRRGAALVGVCGLVLGGLLVFAGRRSRREVAPTTPAAPAPAVPPFGPPPAWPPQAPRVQPPSAFATPPPPGSGALPPPGSPIAPPTPPAPTVMSPPSAPLAPPAPPPPDTPAPPGNAWGPPSVTSDDEGDGEPVD